MIKSMFILVAFFTINFANADIVPSGQNRPMYDNTCRYINNFVVRARTCGSPICFGFIQCGVRNTSVSCLALNGRCPSPQTCLEDPNVQFVDNTVYNVAGTSESSNTSTGVSVAK